MDKLLAGTVGGLIATAPMTVAMELMHRQLPSSEQYPLPPREITMAAAAEAGVHHRMEEPEKMGATLTAHFAYGAACGAVFSTLLDKRIPGNPALKGAGFGLAVWTVSYLGLLPAMGILRSAAEHPVRRNALMIAAHGVWGVVAGLTASALADQNTPER